MDLIFLLSFPPHQQASRGAETETEMIASLPGSKAAANWAGGMDAFGGEASNVDLDRLQSKHFFMVISSPQTIFKATQESLICCFHGGL